MVMTESSPRASNCNLKRMSKEGQRTMLNSTALLIIDPQRVYTDEESELYCADATQTIVRINRLTELGSRLGWLVVTVRHVHKADGTDLGRMFDFAGDESGEFNFREGTNEVAYDER